MDGYDRVAVVVLAGELHRHLDRVDVGGELGEQRFDVGVDALPFLLQFEQNVELFRFRFDRLGAGDALLDARALAPYVLRGLGVVPETGNGHLALDLVERLPRGREVKDSSGRCEVGSGGRR